MSFPVWINNPLLRKNTRSAIQRRSLRLAFERLETRTNPSGGTPLDLAAAVAPEETVDVPVAFVSDAQEPQDATDPSTIEIVDSSVIDAVFVDPSLIEASIGVAQEAIAAPATEDDAMTQNSDFELPPEMEQPEVAPNADGSDDMSGADLMPPDADGEFAPDTMEPVLGTVLLDPPPMPSVADDAIDGAVDVTVAISDEPAPAFDGSAPLPDDLAYAAAPEAPMTNDSAIAVEEVIPAAIISDASTAKSDLTASEVESSTASAHAASAVIGLSPALVRISVSLPSTSFVVAKTYEPLSVNLFAFETKTASKSDSSPVTTTLTAAKSTDHHLAYLDGAGFSGFVAEGTVVAEEPMTPAEDTQIAGGE